MTTSTQAPGLELAKRPSESLALPALSIDTAIERRNAMVSFVKKIMVAGVDYGKVPGTDKDTLLKAGAEKLATFFGMTTKFELVERVEDWTGADHGGEPFFYYLYRCHMYRGDVMIAESDGSCNSWEIKYRWRWVSERDVPAKLVKANLVTRSGSIREPEFAIRKRETGGKYGKPASYWDRFEQAIADGSARQVDFPKKDGGRMVGWEIGSLQYRVPNEDIAGQVNTIQKMSQKRALVGTTLLAVNASEYFTQDLDDMDMIDNGGSTARPPAEDHANHSQDVEYQTLASGEPDLSHDKTFFAEWDRASVSRGVNQQRGRAFLLHVLKKNELELGDTDFDWRKERLDRLAHGDFDRLLKPEDAGEKPMQVTARRTDAANSQTKADTTDAADAQLDGPTRNDFLSVDNFWAWMAEVCPQVTEDEMKSAVEEFAKRSKKTAADLSADQRLRIWKAASAGLFTIPGGTIVTKHAEPATASAT